MRKVTASLALLVVVLAVFAPVAHATVLRNAHACCFKKQHAGAAVGRQDSADPAQHACCSLATLAATPAAQPALSSRPQTSHPFVTEYHPDADSSHSVRRQADRAPPATDRSDR